MRLHGIVWLVPTVLLFGCQDQQGLVAPEPALDVSGTVIATPLTLVGDAQYIGTGIRLTPSEFFRRGAAWFSTKAVVRNGFTASFEFQITELAGIGDESGEVGGDGLALVIQDESATAIGNFGQFQGYGGIPRSVAVEFDLWQNFGEGDGNHISVQTRGVEPNSDAAEFSLGSMTPPVRMSDGSLHTVQIEYTPGALEVFLDGVRQLSVSLDFTMIDGSSMLDANGAAWVGVTAATGAAFQIHDVYNPRLKGPPTPPGRASPCSSLRGLLFDGRECALLSQLRDPAYFAVGEELVSDGALFDFVRRNTTKVEALIKQIDYGRGVERFLDGQISFLENEREFIRALRVSGDLTGFLEFIIDILAALQQTAALEVTGQSLNIIGQVIDGITVYTIAKVRFTELNRRIIVQFYTDARAAGVSPDAAWQELLDDPVLGVFIPQLSRVQNIPVENLDEWLENAFAAYRLVGRRFPDAGQVRSAQGQAIAELALQGS